MALLSTLGKFGISEAASLEKFGAPETSLDSFFLEEFRAELERYKTGHDSYILENMLVTIENMKLKSALPETPQEKLKKLIKKEGYDANIAKSGVEALAQIKDDEFDLIVSDIRMPDMNGFDLLDTIRKLPKLSSTPVVFFSAIDDYDARKTARDLGAADYIVKPFDQEEVASVLHKHLRMP